MSVRRAQSEVSSAEFAEWWEYYKLEPFGQERDNMHAAIVATTVANAHGAKTKIADFMLKIGETAKRQTPKQIMAVLKMFTQWFNGKGNDDANGSLN